MRFRVGARTDVGRVREGNEDAFMVDDPLFAVADGMGGHQGGEVASNLALERLKRVADGEDSSLADVVRQANRAVFNKAAEDPRLAGMGTTLTAVMAGSEGLRLAHVGDSRAYLIRDGQMERITKDHTVVERLVEEGRLTPQEAQIHPQRSILTRALGVEEDVEVDESTVEVRAGDRLLLCSDGLTGMIGDDEIHRILAEQEDPQAACDLLVEEANRAGGQDNVTVVVIDVLEGEKTPEGRGRSWAARLTLWALLPVVLIGAALFTIKELFIDRQWFVGESDGLVAVYRGVPAEPLGINLATLVDETALTVTEVLQFREYQNLNEGITAESEADARAIVAQMQRDVEAQRLEEAQP